MNSGVYSITCVVDNKISQITLRDYLRGNIKNKTKLKLYDEVGNPTEVDR